VAAADSIPSDTSVRRKGEARVKVNWKVTVYQMHWH